MNSHRLVQASFVAFGIFLGAGCAVTPGDAADPGTDSAAGEEPIAETSELLSVDHGAVNDMHVWASSVINSPSWMSITCSDTYRTGNDNFMLTDLGAFKEPTTNFDNFIGKLNGTCTDYTTSGTQTGTPQKDNIFSGNWRPGELTVSVPSNEVPVGVVLKVYSGSPSYVKDIAIAHTLPTFGAPTTWTPFATGYSGTQVSGLCNPGEVMTGLNLAYNTGNGKIEHVHIFCRTFS